MLKDIKKILYYEIKDEIDKYKSLKSEIEELQNEIENLKKTDSNVLYPTEISEKKYNFFQRHITKRKEYLKYIKDKEEYQRICSEYEKKQEENKSLMEKLQNKKSELESEFSKIENLTRARYEKIKNAKTLKQLDITFEGAEKILKDNGKSVVLDESDREITENESEFDKPEDFILVHKTPYSPTNNEVKSNIDSGARTKNTIQFEDEEFSYDYLQSRSTVHFCQNGEVSSHINGNFDGRKYAVLVPFKNVKRDDNLQTFSPQDTFLKNKVDISEGYILCPIGEVERVQSQNSNTTVIGYEGESVDGFADSFLSMLGYRHVKVGKNKWLSEEDTKKHNRFVENNEDLHYGTHDGSRMEQIDNLVKGYNKIIGFAESLVRYKKEGKKYNVDKLVENLFSIEKKVTLESGEKKVEVPNISLLRFSDIEDSSYMIVGNKSFDLNLKDIIKDPEYKDEEDDVKESNRKFLFYQLKKQFNIDIPEDILEAFNHYGSGIYMDNKVELDVFKSKISDKETVKFLDNLIENEKIKNLRDAKDVLFIRTIVQQVYERTEDKDKKNQENVDKKLQEDEEVEI